MQHYCFREHYESISSLGPCSGDHAFSDQRGDLAKRTSRFRQREEGFQRLIALFDHSNKLSQCLVYNLNDRGVPFRAKITFENQDQVTVRKGDHPYRPFPPLLSLCRGSGLDRLVAVQFRGENDNSKDGGF